MSATPDLPARVRAAEAPTDADRAILRTVSYAGLFRSPLTLPQLERRLMDVPLDLPALRARLAGPFLAERLVLKDGLVHPAGREEWIEVREERRRHTRALLDRHRRVLTALAAFPFVRLVALSGGCAHDNATDDDVDVFLVVAPDRAWAVCLALTLLSKLLGVRRTLCLNYIVDEEAMALPERDVFTAAEIVGMQPLAGRSAYLRFVEANAWAAHLFPNFFEAYRQEAETVPEVRASPWAEKLLGLSLLEAASRWLLGAWLRRKAGGAPGVVLSAHRLKLHTQDHRPRLSALFEVALREAGEQV